jgi:heat shock protein HslJ
MNKRHTHQICFESDKRYLSIGLLSILALCALVLSGCAMGKGSAAKEPPCLVAPDHLAGLYGMRLTPADSPWQMIRVRLFPGTRAEMITDFLDGKPALIENGLWECRSSTVTVKLTGRIGQAYEKPEILKFTIDGEGLTPFEYDRDKWGNEGLHLERNPAVIGIVWRLVQIQYTNNTAVVPDDPAKYALILSQDGTVTVRADCNRGMGTYLMAGPWLLMRKHSYTRMICQENSLYELYTKALESAESCALRDGNLYFTLQGNSGIMKFEPAKLVE